MASPIGKFISIREQLMANISYTQQLEQKCAHLEYSIMVYEMQLASFTRLQQVNADLAFRNEILQKRNGDLVAENYYYQAVVMSKSTPGPSQSLRMVPSAVPAVPSAVPISKTVNETK